MELQTENFNPQELISQAEGIADKREFILSSIIPAMNTLRGRVEPMSQTEVIFKLFSTDEKKPGEVIELLNEVEESGKTITPRIASELADIVYYTLQPNCGELSRDCSTLVEGFNISMDKAYMFCILKYSTRMRFGKRGDYKQLEYEVLENYLST